MVDEPRASQALSRAAPEGAGSRTRGAARAADPGGGCPRMTTSRHQLDMPLAAALRYPLELIDRFEWETEMPDGPDNRVSPTAPHLEGAGRRRRRHRALELPVRGDDQQARSGARDRKHGGAEAGAGHAVERHAARSARSQRRPISARRASTSSRRRITCSARI